MSQIKAHDYQHIYDRMGINLNKLGCVMIDFRLEDILGDIKFATVSGIPYNSPDPDKFWIRGLLTEHHTTIRYGLLPQVTIEDCKEVLGNRALPEFTRIYGTLDIFPSPIPDEPYDCLVMKIAPSGIMQEMSDSLAILPNILTYSPPTPHITIGYFKKGTLSINRVIGYQVTANIHNMHVTFGKHMQERDNDSR